ASTRSASPRCARACAPPRSTSLGGSRERAMTERAAEPSARAWLDGRVIPLADARIPINDHGLLYGDGIFEGIRIRAGRVFRLGDHLERFAAAARAIGLALPGGTTVARAAVLETARAFGEREAYVRLVCTRGVGALGVDPLPCRDPRLFCIVDRIRLYAAR